MADEVRDERPRPWAWFDHEIIDVYAARIGPMGLAVYMALLRFCGHNQTCYPSSDTLERKLGLSHQSIWRAIQKLVEAKLISVERRLSGPKGRASNIYIIQRPWCPPSTGDEGYVPNRNIPNPSESLENDQVCSPQEQTEGEVCSPGEQTVCSYWEHEVDTKRRTRKKKKTKDSLSSTDVAEETATAPKVQELVEAWNAICAEHGKLPRKKIVSEKLKQQIRLRLREHPDAEFWEVVLNKCVDSKFLSGKRTSFRATLDFLVKNGENAIRVYEGSYDDANRT